MGRKVVKAVDCCYKIALTPRREVETMVGPVRHKRRLNSGADAPSLHLPLTQFEPGSNPFHVTFDAF
jgi:hypothetical protein